MNSNYYLMRKDEIVTAVTIDETGNMISFYKDGIRKDIAPLQHKYLDSWLIRWWQERAVPVSQGNIRFVLQQNGFFSPSEFLIQNLGLSLTDYYWVKPVDSNLTWENVSLFSNPFKESIFFKFSKENPVQTPLYSPASSLTGDVEKAWGIIDQKCCIIKGNSSNLSSESINEVIASKLHSLQGYDNYTDYQLLHIPGKDYDYGCYAPSFTSEKREFISAYAICSSEKRSNDCSLFEHFIRICTKYGMNEKLLRQDLEYQIMTDFILSGYDRHLNNLGVIRDADTLQFIRLAPIFDSGASLFVNREKPHKTKDLLNISTNSFAAKENGLLKYVKDKNCIDLSKLPSSSYIRFMYEKDSQVSKGLIDAIIFGYEQKIEICHKLQQGIDPWQYDTAR